MFTQDLTVQFDRGFNDSNDIRKGVYITKDITTNRWNSPPTYIFPAHRN